jgi:hypothetical protein
VFQVIEMCPLGMQNGFKVGGEKSSMTTPLFTEKDNGQQITPFDMQRSCCECMATGLAARPKRDEGIFGQAKIPFPYARRKQHSIAFANRRGALGCLKPPAPHKMVPLQLCLAIAYRILFAFDGCPQKVREISFTPQDGYEGVNLTDIIEVKYQKRKKCAR